MMKAIADRPWIWIIVGLVAMMSATITFVVISIKYGPAEIPIAHQQSDY
jgi:uncharacterized membrane protein